MLYVPLCSQNSFRISAGRRYNSQNIQSRRVALPIPPPVLWQYNYIDLQKNNNLRRINHVSANLKTPKDKFKKQASPNKWEQALHRYMLNKQKIQTRKGSIYNEFEFLKLSKRNRYRKKKLAQQNSIPINKFSSTFYNKTQQHEPISHSCNFKNAIKLNSDIFSLKHIERSPIQKHQNQRKNQISPQSCSAESQQERILSKFVTSYFKKKYKKSKQFSAVAQKKSSINLQSITMSKNSRQNTN